MSKREIDDKSINEFNSKVYTYATSDDEDLRSKVECDIINFVKSIKRDLEKGIDIEIPKLQLNFHTKEKFNEFLNGEKYRELGLDKLKKYFRTELEKYDEFCESMTEELRWKIKREDEEIKKSENMDKISEYKEHIEYYNKKLEEYKVNK